MAFLVVISAPAKILMLSTGDRTATHSRVSHAHIPFFVSVREAKLVLTEKSQVIRLCRLTRGSRQEEEGDRDDDGEVEEESASKAVRNWRVSGARGARNLPFWRGIQ